MDLFFTFIGPNIYKQRESMCKKTWTSLFQRCNTFICFQQRGRPLLPAWAQRSRSRRT